MNLLRCTFTLIFSTTFLPAATTDWPRFLGPAGAAIVKESRIPLTWSDTENLLWKTDLPGPGASSPIVLGNKVFLTCWTGYGDKPGEGVNPGDMRQLTRHLLCLSRADGQILWDAKVPSAAAEDPFTGFITEHGYATHTPVTDGEHVYVFFGKSGALAFDLQGRQLWQTSCGTGSGERRWGSAASPILHGSLLIINATDESQKLYGLDKQTGKMVWQAEGDFGMAYSTPNILKRGGVDDLVIAIPRELWGMNPDTGKLRWYASHGLTGNVSPSLIPGGGDTVYVFGGFPATRSTAIKLGGKGDLGPGAILWDSSSSSYVPTPILKDGHLYVINDQGFALCIDAKTGNDVYRERATMGSRGGGKPFYASPVLVGDKLICVSRRNGAFVLAAKPKYELLATNEFASDTTHFNGTPAISGDRLILRSNKAVYCVGTK